MTSKVLKGRSSLKSLSTEVDQVDQAEPAVTTFALVDAVVMKASILAERLRSLEDALKSAGEAGALKDEPKSAGLNGKLENAARNLGFVDDTLQDVVDYLGVEI
jgi:hypothetical protein